MRQTLSLQIFCSCWYYIFYHVGRNLKIRFLITQMRKSKLSWARTLSEASSLSILEYLLHSSDVNSVTSQPCEVFTWVLKQVYASRGPSQLSTSFHSQLILRIYAATNEPGGGAQTDCPRAREALGTPLNNGVCVWRLPEQGVVWHEKMLFGMCVMFFFSFFSACLAFTDVVWHVLSSDLGYLVHTNLESLIVSVFSQWLHFVIDILMPSKRRISVKNWSWLRIKNDVTGVSKADILRWAMASQQSYFLLAVVHSPANSTKHCLQKARL